MTNNPFTPEQESWRWYEDDAAEPTAALANEDTEYTLTSTTEVLRLRIVIEETGTDTSANNVDLGLQYSTNDTDFTAFGAANHWDYYNGQATQGNDTTSYLVANTVPGQAGNHGEYYESEGGAGTEDIAKSNRYEMDFCIQPTANATEGQRYYFRITIDNPSPGTVIPTYSGKVHAFVTTYSTPTPAVSSHTYFKTPQFSGTSHHVAIGWNWNSGCYYSASGMRATSDEPDTWDWAVISSSSDYYYPSGNPTAWIWVSGSYQGGGQP
jgi:hypothetical protein